MCLIRKVRQPVSVGVARLERRDEAARILLQLAQLVELGIEAGADEAAVALQERQLVGERAASPSATSVRRPCRHLRGLAQLLRQIGRDGEFEPELARREQAVAHAGEIARAAAAEAEARQRARHVGRALEDAPQPVAQVVVLDERTRRNPAGRGSGPDR